MKNNILKLNTKSATLVSGGVEHTWTYMTFAVLGISMALYFYLVASTSFNVAGRVNAENELRVVKSSLSELELEYLAAGNSISLDLARSLGYLEANNAVFISKNTVAKGLTLRDGSY
jgi:hypothetical protein